MFFIHDGMYTILHTYTSIRNKKIFTMQNRPAPLRPASSLLQDRRSTLQSLQVFKRLLHQTQLKLAMEKAELGFYNRIFTPTVTLWYMIFQRLTHDHTLQAAVSDLHSGGADRLSSRKERPLSTQIRSLATTAFSKARQRIPLALFSSVLGAQAQDVWDEIQDVKWHGLRVLLLDGSQISLRPYPDIVNQFATSSNQNGQIYWVLMRVVVTFCLHTGMVVSSAADSSRVSEQILACRQILKNRAGCLYLGDRNFGVFQMVQGVLTAKAHCLFRLSESRAKKVAGSLSRLLPGDYPVAWSPSRHDLKYEGCCPHALDGRLIVAQYSRPGFRTQWIYLFTSLLDSSAFSPQTLIELYGSRWQAELNLRYLKTHMDLHQLDCKTKDMAEKEWLSGIMAYNLVRVVMAMAAKMKGIHPSLLSFSSARRLLLRWLLTSRSHHTLYKSSRTLLNNLARARLPSRKKPRPPEPRAKRHKRETFPPLRGNRAAARENLRIHNMKC
jgi:hypothetical protein